MSPVINHADPIKFLKTMKDIKCVYERYDELSLYFTFELTLGADGKINYSSESKRENIKPETCEKNSD